MIKKSIAFFFVLFLLHVTVVAMFPNVGEATSGYSINVVRAQHFYYDTESDYAVLGTSLAGMINEDSIPSISLIAFGACTVEDGLRLILAKKTRPSKVFIETNLLYKKGDKTFTDKITKGFLPVVRWAVPSLREQYTPVNMLNWLIRSVVLNGSLKSYSAVINMKILHDNIKRLNKEWIAFPESVFNERRDVIKSLIQEIKNQGTEIVFFEMPVNKECVNLGIFVQNRNSVNIDFPRSEYTHIDNDTSTYITTDGIHLDLEGRERYSHFMKEKVELIIGKR